MNADDMLLSVGHGMAIVDMMAYASNLTGLGARGSMTDLYERRAAVIRDLAQGEGLTEEKAAAIAWTADFEVPGITADLLVRRIDVASTAVADPRHREAIRNALGLGQKSDGNLTDRRNRMIGSDKRLSYRTLIRHEAEGALALAHVLDHVEEYMEGSATRDELLERVKDLELLVYSLMRMNDRLVVAMGEMEEVVREKVNLLAKKQHENTPRATNPSDPAASNLLTILNQSIASSGLVPETDVDVFVTGNSWEPLSGRVEGTVRAIKQRVEEEVGTQLDDIRT